jgi:hypothetical protein
MTSIYFAFFLVFFFFAMTLFLGVGDEPSAGLVQVASLIAVLILSPSEQWHKASSRRNQKTKITLIFLELNGYSLCH